MPRCDSYLWLVVVHWLTPYTWYLILAIDPTELRPLSHNFTMRILLIDDHTLFAESLCFLLRQMDAGVEATTVRTVEQALALPAPHHLALLDLQLPNVVGFAGLHRLRSAWPDVPVVIVSGEEHPGTIQAAIDAGAMGYVPKTSSPQVLMAALKLILAGGVYLPMHLLQRAGIGTGAGLDPASTDPLERAALGGLSRRQRQVLMKVVQGKPNKLIARELDIAESTVKSHLSTAYRALDVSNRTEAVFKTAHLGLFV